MESTSKMPKHGFRGVETQTPIEKVSVKTDYVPNTTSLSTKRVRLRVDANWKIRGRSSGRDYLFKGAGSVQDVDERDVEYFLSLRQGKGCCGSTTGNTVFELA